VALFDLRSYLPVQYPPAPLFLDTLVILSSFIFAAVVRIACNPRGGYFCPRPLMPGSGHVYHVSQLEKCDRKRVGALCSQLKLRQVRYRIRHETGGIRWTNSWNSLFTSLSNDWSAMLLCWVSADRARHGAKLTCHSSLLIHNWWKVPRLARILPPSQLPYLRSAGLPGA
jgi:hypothetical protein